MEALRGVSSNLWMVEWIYTETLPVDDDRSGELS
jgi:hypothetical protein